MDNKSDSSRGLGLLITDVSHLMRRNFDRRLQSLGLTQAQWRAISRLARHEGMNQASLADALEVQPITVGRLIDRMQAAGWVERRSDPQDRRAVRLYLTEKCQPILEEMQARATEMLSEILAGIPTDALTQLTETLHAMKANLSAAESSFGNQQSNGRTNTHVAKRTHS